MTGHFFRGVIAGYGIAIPVGAIAVLIIESSVRRGFRHGFAAGAGAASADLVYATLAAGAGTILAPLVAPAAGLIGLVSGLVLLSIAISGLRSVRRRSNDSADAGTTIESAVATYLRFIALTIVNPMTVIYFSALLLGTSAHMNSPSMAAFVAGAFLASLSWQTVLAMIGALAHATAGDSFRRASGLVGNLVILGFAITTLLRSWPS